VTAAEAVAAAVPAAALAFERVTIRYDDLVAVDGVSFTVAPGEWVALIGPNGAGKSSLLRAVTGQVRYGGEVFESGVATRSLSWRDRARRTALVPQQPELPAAMPVLDYVLLGRTPHIGYLGRESAHDLLVCQSLLERLHLSRFADRPISTLSGGETQRAVLARALAQQAPVLLLDEPTSALDIGRRVEALELVDALRRERALTVLSVLHDLTLAAQFADRLVLLVDGTVRASGTPAEVLDPGVLAASYGARVRVLTGDDGRLVVVPQRAERKHPEPS
jgi:iron complex transport system ATP-binding protein